MVKIFRISGYLVSKGHYNLEDLLECLEDFCEADEMWQQLHVEESEEFKQDGELDENCDLALLTRHFKKSGDINMFGRAIPQPGEKYRHFKIGKVVTVIGISRHTETEEVSVVYEYEGTIWNRPLEMFLMPIDKEKYPDTEQYWRFEKVEE